MLTAIVFGLAASSWPVGAVTRAPGVV